MVGNVLEWVKDCWNVTYSSAPNDGSAWEEGDCTVRMARGGHIGSIPEFSRIPTRWVRRPDREENYIGFQLAKTIEP